jgi:hypothetical protein
MIPIVLVTALEDQRAASAASLALTISFPAGALRGAGRTR